MRWPAVRAVLTAVNGTTGAGLFRRNTRVTGDDLLAA